MFESAECNMVSHWCAELASLPHSTLNSAHMRHASQPHLVSFSFTLPDVQKLSALCSEQQLLHASQLGQPLLDGFLCCCNGACNLLLLHPQRLALHPASYSVSGNAKGPSAVCYVSAESLQTMSMKRCIRSCIYRKLQNTCQVSAKCQDLLLCGMSADCQGVLL